MVTIANEPVIINDEPLIIEPELLELEPEPEPEPELEPEPEQEQPTEPPTPKKKPGRPVGSKSKEPGKPRAKRVKIVEEAVPHNPPSPVEQSRPIPTSRDSQSALMLQMLSQHAKERQNRKADLWKSWFR